MINLRKIKSLIIKILIIYALYVFISGILIFLFYHPNTTYLNNIELERFRNGETGPDRVALIEDKHEAGLSRINLIESAEETLDIAYYTIHEGISSNIFYGKVLEAADRGIRVRILLDGIFHNLRGTSRNIKYALIIHPNIELKFYEPLNLLKPWTWNNRLHDKYIIMDKELAMLGGRNIGDRYFFEDQHNDIVYDRDIVIINTNNNLSGSVLQEIKLYYNKIWNHRFSQTAAENLKNYQTGRGIEKTKYLREFTQKINEGHLEVFGPPLDWHEISVSTNKITLVHNPLERFNKEPHVLSEIVKLMEESETTFIQSPYVIPSSQMTKLICTEDILEKEIRLLTNSLASSPNYPAIAGYLNKRKGIINHGVQVYEYQGEGSIHAKSLIFDNQLSLIGTFNIDARSSFLSTESIVVIDSEEFTSLLIEAVDDLKKESLLVKEDCSYEINPGVEKRNTSALKTLIINFFRILFYSFDFML